MKSNLEDEKRKNDIRKYKQRQESSVNEDHKIYIHLAIFSLNTRTLEKFT